jgi:hypothetical protein
VWEASFAEIEKVLGRPLPNSAYRHQAWWANQSGAGHSQTRGWQSVGWRTTKLDLERKRVKFERVRGGPTLRADEASVPTEELWSRAMALTGITQRSALTKEALRALIAREAAACLIGAGGSAPEYQPAARERPAS